MRLNELSCTETHYNLSQAMKIAAIARKIQN